MFDILEGTEMRVSNLMLMLSDEEAQLPVHGGEISLRPRPQHSEERVSDELGERPVFAFRGNVFLLGGRGGTEVPDEQEGGGGERPNRFTLMTPTSQHPVAPRERGESGHLAPHPQIEALFQRQAPPPV